MHLLWKRYSRSGYAPPWFYWLIAAGFVALFIWGAVTQDWLVAVVALVMVPTTLVGSRMLRRAGSADAERAHERPGEMEDRDG